jgi:predicted N-acetyltransferase YhbS
MTLADGATLRWATPADAPAYAALATHAFRIGVDNDPNPNVAAYAHDLTGDAHPLCASGDVAVVEYGGEIVAAAALMTQPLAYAGITVAAGRPELVCSHSDVRQRGYVRAIMQALHAKSAARGDLIQVITGIPHYYHQYGYAWAIDYNGFARVDRAFIEAKPAPAELVTLRLLRADEYQLFAAAYQADPAYQACLVKTPYSEAVFRHAHETSVSTEGFCAYGICTADGALIGTMLIEKRIWDGAAVVHVWNYRDAATAVQYGIATLHAVVALGATLPKPVASHKAFCAVDISTDGGHPCRQLLQHLGIGATALTPYTWYIRVPDVPRFLLHIAPLLEQRLSASVAAGYTGVLDITTYRGGVVLEWEQGRLAGVRPRVAAAYGDSPSAGFHPDALVQLLFGWRSLHELQDWYPDVWTSDQSALLLNILFPAAPSRLLWLN